MSYFTGGVSNFQEFDRIHLEWKEIWYSVKVRQNIKKKILFNDVLRDINGEVKPGEVLSRLFDVFLIVLKYDVIGFNDTWGVWSW